MGSSAPCFKRAIEGAAQRSVWPLRSRHLDATRREELAIAEIGQSATEIEYKQIRDRHREVREALRGYRQFLQLHMALSHGAFDGRARLAAVQHDRLVIDNGPLVEQIRVAADGIGTTPWI